MFKNQTTNTLQLTDMWIKSTSLLQICYSEAGPCFLWSWCSKPSVFVKICVMRTINGYWNKKSCLCQSALLVLLLCSQSDWRWFCVSELLHLFCMWAGCFFWLEERKRGEKAAKSHKNWTKKSASAGLMERSLQILHFWLKRLSIYKEEVRRTLEQWTAM